MFSSPAVPTPQERLLSAPADEARPLEARDAIAAVLAALGVLDLLRGAHFNDVPADAAGKLEALGPVLLGRSLCERTWALPGAGWHTFSDLEAPLRAMVRALHRAREPQRTRAGRVWEKDADGKIPMQAPVGRPGLLPWYVRKEFFAGLRLEIESEREQTNGEGLAAQLLERDEQASNPWAPAEDRADVIDRRRDVTRVIAAVLQELDPRTLRIVRLALSGDHDDGQIGHILEISQRTVRRGIKEARDKFTLRGVQFDALREVGVLQSRHAREGHEGLRRLLRPMTPAEAEERYRGYRIPGSVHPSHLTTNNEESPAMNRKQTRTPGPQEVVTIRAIRDLGRVVLRTGDSEQRGVQRWVHMTGTYAEAMEEIVRLRTARKPGDPTIYGIGRDRAAAVVPNGVPVVAPDAANEGAIPASIATDSVERVAA